MSIHITKFLDRIKAADSRGQRDVTMTVNEARDLHADITKLLLIAEELRQQTQANTAPTVDIEVQGGSF